MLYKSTRSDKNAEFESAYVIKNGLAADGGLYVPKELPQISVDDLDSLRHMDYPHRAADILSRFLTDYTYDELLADCQSAYREESFPGGAAPMSAEYNGQRLLELWHGPTAAFKDMALQIMPRLLSRALVKTGETRCAYILVATSGDTGKAALEGYRDVPHTRITVFYPVDGVSRVQKLQMATQLGENVKVYAIEGNFDDAQNGVKLLFGDAEMGQTRAADRLLRLGLLRHAEFRRCETGRRGKYLRSHGQFRQYSCGLHREMCRTSVRAAHMRVEHKQRSDRLPHVRHL